MIKRENYNKIFNAIEKSNASTIIIFGSYSRGDYDDNSDIDILEITNQKKSPHSEDKFNFSPYTIQELVEMAKLGNLFVLHLIQDGKVLRGDFNLLNKLSDVFIKRKNYNSYRKELVDTASILDVSAKYYDENRKGYFGLLLYLFRSYLYSLMYDDKNVVKFSIKDLALYFNDIKIIECFNRKHQKTVSYNDFLTCKLVFEKYANSRFVNIYSNPIEGLRRLKDCNSPGFSIALHFLKEYANEVYSF